MAIPRPISIETYPLTDFPKDSNFHEFDQRLRVSIPALLGRHLNAKVSPVQGDSSVAQPVKGLNDHCDIGAEVRETSLKTQALKRVARPEKSSICSNAVQRTVGRTET